MYVPEKDNYYNAFSAILLKLTALISAANYISAQEVFLDDYS
jgi:hypothetical protein